VPVVVTAGPLSAKATPRKMNWSPATAVCEAQFPVQFGIPGACSRGVALLVPLFKSKPFAAM
jgi:hypothetical protein